jgi:TIR domain
VQFSSILVDPVGRSRSPCLQTLFVCDCASRQLTVVMLPDSPDDSSANIVPFRAPPSSPRISSRRISRKTESKSTIFIDYYKSDKRYLDELLVHLAPLRAQGIVTWSDKNLLPGDERLKIIRDALESAKVIVVFVSARYIESYISSPCCAFKTA